MQISKTALLTALTASTAMASPAVVTVTEHVHQEATVTVQGFVYYNEGALTTTYVTLNGVAQIAASTPTSASASAAAVKSVAPAASSAKHVSAVAATNVAATTLKTSSKSSKAPVEVTTKPTSTTSATSQKQGQAVTVTAKGQATTVQQATFIGTTNKGKDTTSTHTRTTVVQRPTDNVNLSEFASSMLAEHNAKRELHKNTPDLTWSESLASYAQNYADNYDCSGNLVHSGGPHGENLAVGYGTTGAVDAWYNEISQYDYSNPGFSSNSGHFTQLVWKSTSQVGCGVKACGGVWGAYVICSYDPAGNVSGEYADNVQPLN